MRLVIANLNYSSWSIRAWLALRLANIQFSTHDVGLKCHPDWKNRILQFSGAGKVPVLIDGPLSIHESLAICEYANEIAPTAKLWPDDRALRARGRAISCEMASSFATLRQLMPCNIRGRSKATPHTAQLEQELARLMDIWDASLSTSAGGYLLGDHMTIADCMYTPVLFRMRTYGVPLSQRIQGYSDLILNHPLILELEQLAAATEAIAEYDAHLVE